MAKEIEILFALKSGFKQAKAALAQFDFKGEKKTFDIYYYDPLRNALQSDAENRLRDVCRLREKDGKYFVAYKSNHYEGDHWFYSDEYETEISDLKAMQEIMTHLGLKPLLTIDNTKHVYETDRYEIVLEDVKDLGYFIEVEARNVDETKSVQEVKEEIRAFIQGLGLDLGPELNFGKPELLLLKQSLI